VRAVDLFAGAGGLSAGLHKAGFDVDLAVEADQAAVTAYRRIHPQAEVWPELVQPAKLRRLRGTVDLLAAGPPCQPFSTAGKRLGCRDPRDGFPALLESIDAVRPSNVLIENVAGLASGKRLEYLSSVILELRSRGYIVVSRVLDAADFGVRQHRRRLFIVATKDRQFGFPAATHGPTANRPWLSCEPILRRRKAASDTSNVSAVIFAKRPHLRASPFSGLLFNGSGRPLCPERPAPTILASAGGNKTHFIDRLDEVPKYHRHLIEGGEPRRGKLIGAERLSPGQCAALQTLPQTAFKGPPSTRYRLIGNAVPPKLAQAVGGHLLMHLTGELNSSGSPQEEHQPTHQ